MKRIFACGILAAAAAGCSDSLTAPIEAARPVPTQINFARSATVPIAGRYIVVFKNSVADVDAEAAVIGRRHGGTLRHVYKSALRGMTIDIPDAKVAALRAEPSVAYVEQDQTMSISMRFDSPLVNAASGQCLATQNGSAAAATFAAMAPCSGATAQVLSLPAVGIAGPIRFFSGATCFDDLQVTGSVGNVVGIYPCHGGANQNWTLTSAGEVKGNGLCVTPTGATVTLQTCTGSASQRWTTGAVAPPGAPVTVTQTGATWGLDRLDQRVLPLNGSFAYQADGTGVTAYIFDSGINFAHDEFGGRATTGFDAITPGGNAADCNGHGTHVAGTVGGGTYGVAKKVRLVAVRVLDCNGSGTTSSLIAGIDWMNANRMAPAVANLSLGGGYSQASNDAIARSAAAGVVVTVAAGNSAVDACTTSPASAPDAIAVGATDNTDTFASFSNHGSCVRINAPGVNIVSAWIGSNTITVGASGTSMAAPHVAGAVAAYLQRNPGATPAQVRAALTGSATANVIRGTLSGTPNLLLYSSSGG